MGRVLPETVVDKVVDSLVEKEVERRAGALTAAMDLHKNTLKELNKVRPDVKMFDEDGKPVHEGYSKEKLEERKKLVAKIEKIESTIAKATENNEWSPLFDLK